MKKQLNMLVVSDIHESREYVDKLILNENLPTIDLILLLGDFLNIQHPITEQKEIEQIEILKQLLSPFNKWKCPIYLIPGNHDYDGLYNGQQLNNQIRNIEGQCVQIAENLQIVALGGSTPGYFKNGEQIWEGYPYQNEEQFRNKLVSLPKGKGQIILMTHIGPDISQTSISFEYGINKEIQSGSKAISELIINNNVLLNIHGHTHDGVGSRLINQTKIVNAGPLLNGNYAIISLQLNENEWKITQIQHKIL